MKTSPVILTLSAFMIGGAELYAAESAPAASAQISMQKTSKIRAGDYVSIVVYGHEKLGVSNALVDATGELRVAGISEAIPAAGLSVADIQAIVESRYKKAGFEDPQVSVYGRTIDGNRVRLVCSVPAVRVPGDPIRLDAKQN